MAEIFMAEEAKFITHNLSHCPTCVRVWDSDDIMGTYVYVKDHSLAMSLDGVIKTESLNSVKSASSQPKPSPFQNLSICSEALYVKVKKYHFFVTFIATLYITRPPPPRSTVWIALALAVKRTNSRRPKQILIRDHRTWSRAGFQNNN